MRFVVISRPTTTDGRDRHRDEEERLLTRMREDGFVQQIYRRADGEGAYSIVEASSEEEARRRLAELPFVAHRCIDIEVIRVEPRYG